jgi:hypothetical protein
MQWDEVTSHGGSLANDACQGSTEDFDAFHSIRDTLVYRAVVTVQVDLPGGTRPSRPDSASVVVGRLGEATRYRSADPAY